MSLDNPGVESPASLATPSAQVASLRARTEGLAVFVLAGLILWLALVSDEHVDQYMYFAHAERLANGQLPYRDFFQGLWPGVTILTSLWFKIFGGSLAGVRILSALLGALSVLAGWALTRKFVPGPMRWIAPSGILTAWIVGNEGILHYSFVTPVALLAMSVAVRADIEGGWKRWACAGTLAAVVGLLNQSSGAWLGLAFVIAALVSPQPGRLARVAATTVGAAFVLVPMVTILALLGALPQFCDNTIILAMTRYRCFHAGVGYGSWIFHWEVLSQFPAVWWPVWVSALLFMRLCVFVLPLLIVLAAIRSWLKPARGQHVLWLAAAALFLSAFPHMGAMRTVRATMPLWPLVAFMAYWIFCQLPRQLRSSQRFEVVCTAMLSACLLAAIPKEWSLRHDLVEIETVRGKARMLPFTAGILELLKKRFTPDSSVLILPQTGCFSWLSGLENPSSYDSIVPVLMPPEYLQTAMAQVRAAGYPPIVFVLDRWSDPKFLMQVFGPSKYTEEFAHNPRDEFLKAEYTLSTQLGILCGAERSLEGYVRIYTRKQP